MLLGVPARRQSLGSAASDPAADGSGRLAGDVREIGAPVSHAGTSGRWDTAIGVRSRRRARVGFGGGRRTACHAPQPVTVIAPSIPASSCGLQKYLYVPGVSNARLND